MNNKVLLLVLVGLLALWGLTRLVTGENDSSYDPIIIKVESKEVTKVVFHAKSDNFEKSVLEKEGDTWSLSKGDRKYDAASENVEEFLKNLASVKTSYIAAKSADKWPEYELNAEQASRVQVFGGENLLSDFYIGKFSVNQQAQQITSFFRLADKNDIYAVQGMAGMMLGQGSNAFRSKQILKLEIPQIETLTYEGDQSYRVQKMGREWQLDKDVLLDTNKVQNFLMNLRTMNGDNFVNGFDEVLNADKLLKTLTINGSNMAQPVIVRCWVDDTKEKPFIIQSSQYPDSYFSSDSIRLFTRIFKPVNEW